MVEHHPTTAGGGVELTLDDKEEYKRVQESWFLGLRNRTCRT